MRVLRTTGFPVRILESIDDNAISQSHGTFDLHHTWTTYMLNRRRDKCELQAPAGRNWREHRGGVGAAFWTGPGIVTFDFPLTGSVVW